MRNRSFRVHRELLCHCHHPCNVQVLDDSDAYHLSAYEHTDHGIDAVFTVRRQHSVLHLLSGGLFLRSKQLKRHCSQAMDRNGSLGNTGYLQFSDFMCRVWNFDSFVCQALTHDTLTNLFILYDIGMNFDLTFNPSSFLLCCFRQ